MSQRTNSDILQITSRPVSVEWSKLIITCRYWRNAITHLIYDPVVPRGRKMFFNNTPTLTANKSNSTDQISNTNTVLLNAWDTCFDKTHSIQLLLMLQWIYWYNAFTAGIQQLLEPGTTIRADFTRASTDLTHEFSFDSADITEEISRSLKKIAPNSETLLELIIEILYFKLLAYFFILFKRWSLRLFFLKASRCVLMANL